MSLFNTSYENEVRIRTKSHQTDELKVLDKNTGEYVDIVANSGGGGGEGGEIPTYIRPGEVNFANKIKIGPTSTSSGVGVTINDSMITINSASGAINTAFGEGVVVSKDENAISLEPGKLTIVSGEEELDFRREDLEVVHNLKNPTPVEGYDPMRRMVVYNMNSKEYNVTDVPEGGGGGGGDSYVPPSYIQGSKIDFSAKSVLDVAGLKVPKLEVTGNNSVTITDIANIAGEILDKPRLKVLDNLYKLQITEDLFDDDSEMVVYNKTTKKYSFRPNFYPLIDTHQLTANSSCKLNTIDHRSIMEGPTAASTLPELELGEKIILSIPKPLKDDDTFYGVYLHDFNATVHRFIVTPLFNYGVDHGSSWIKTLRLPHTGKQMLLVKPMCGSGIEGKDSATASTFEVMIERIV